MLVSNDILLVYGWGGPTGSPSTSNIKGKNTVILYLVSTITPSEGSAEHGAGHW